MSGEQPPQDRQGDGCQDADDEKSAFQRITQHAKEFIEASPEEHKKWLKNTFNKVSFSFQLSFIQLIPDTLFSFLTLLLSLNKPTHSSSAAYRVQIPRLKCMLSLT
jgi:hypothetical protein